MTYFLLIKKKIFYNEIFNFFIEIKDKLFKFKL